ncbi:UV-stimulated scaffold protein A isoform X2 [Hemicordylus capensis]|uniref:UV-stimulated scaffold protein A isoform X2 n=1 Tax=Hemicordylus capensis TaxID=884348 RepID=UPI0023030BB5|nr:UV-stimulated scaffold protein A isoform X2 [Hemicordylus capensis]
MEMDQKLSQLVEDLTTSGEMQLNPRKMKELKKICKSSDEHINHVYHLLMTQLNEDHAEIRLSAFQIVDELFTRSHSFRTLIISNFQKLLELTVETDYEQPLPPPHEVAQKLKKAAIKSIQEWHEKYVDAYKKLSLGYHFLKQKVDFQDINARTLAERRRDEEKQKRLDNIYKDKAKKAEREMEDMSQEIEAVLTEMENGFQLLMPDPFDFMVNDTETVAWRTAEVDKPVSSSSVQMTDRQTPFLEQMDNEQPCCSKDPPSIFLAQKADERDREQTEEQVDREDCSDSELTSIDTGGDNDYTNFVQSHGLGSHKYALSLEISTDMKVYENEDNTAIISNVTDAYKLVRNKFLPSVQSWIQLFTRAGISDNRLRQAIDLKKKLETAMEKHKEMNIDYNEKRKVMKASDDEDDDFVEVPELEDHEHHIPEHLCKLYGLERVSPPKPLGVGRAGETAVANSQIQAKRNEEELDPTCAAATWRIIQDKLPRSKSPDTRNSSDSAASGEPSNKHDEEKAKAPLVPFGLDLFYWGQEQPTAGKILKTLPWMWSAGYIIWMLEGHCLSMSRDLLSGGKLLPCLFSSSSSSSSSILLQLLASKNRSNKYVQYINQ